MPDRPVMVFTDLDGTLLGHDDYAYEPTLPLIKKLQDADIPVVLSTSKTLPEVIEWRRRLGLSGPFMVENGSAIYLSEPAAGVPAAGDPAAGDPAAGDPAAGDPAAGVLAAGSRDTRPDRIVLGVPIKQLRTCLAPFEGSVVDFTTCPLEQAMALTGLDEASTLAARNREFTLPLQVTDPGIEDQLAHSAGAAGFQCTRGGRFLHLQGACNKGMALQEIRRVFENRSGQRPITIALGDNENDRAMLEAADIAVVMRTDNGHVLQLDREQVIYTHQTAPHGWNEGVGTALALLSGTRGG